MVNPPRPDLWDALALAAVLGSLGLAYVVYPDPILQYAVWLTVFTIWMAWFVYFGVKWWHTTV